MFGSRYSLNPHANSFIPNTKSEVIKKMAVKSVTELWQKKKANGEKTITNEEIAKLVGHFISIGFKELENSDKVRIENYLNKKLFSAKIPTARPVSDLYKSRSKLGKQRTFEYYNMNFEAPKMSLLLTAFWGLYRHEQAERPLLSLTYRPDFLKNKTWSVQESDKKLFNPSCVSKVCKCPPMFGYSIPANFFGLPFISNSCPEQKIHLNHYPDSTKSNEFMPTINFQNLSMDEQLFDDNVQNVSKSVDVATLTNQFHKTISGICSLLEEFAEDPDEKVEDSKETEQTGEETYYRSLWDDRNTKMSHIPIFQQSRDTLFDDNDHPLLKIPEMCLGQENIETEVPLEVKEMIRKSLSPMKEEVRTPFIVEDEEESCEEKKNLESCDPPCSVWCDSKSKRNSLKDKNTTSEDAKAFDDTPMVDLISLEQPDTAKTEPIKLSLKSTLNSSDNIKPQHCIFSFNDWTSYFDTKSDIRVTAHTSSSTLDDKIAFPQKKEPSEYLCGRDSGFASRASSEDDLFGELELRERESTWNLVNSEDSLWKPLPECIDTTNTEMNIRQKRGQDFRFGRSAS